MLPSQSQNCKILKMVSKNRGVCCNRNCVLFYFLLISKPEDCVFCLVNSGCSFFMVLGWLQAHPMPHLPSWCSCPQAHWRCSPVVLELQVLPNLALVSKDEGAFYRQLGNRKPPCTPGRVQEVLSGLVADWSSQRTQGICSNVLELFTCH